METVQVESKGTVTWVWLNRPRRLNAMNPTMFDELQQTFEVLENDDTVRAIVLGGRGPAFSAGFDVSWMIGLGTETVARDIGNVRQLYDRIETCNKPLIAVVNGPAMGGGLLLVLVADFCLASEQASFGAPEVRIGIFPPLDLIPRLERRVGLGAAKRMVLTGDPLDAAAAQRIGLVYHILPVDELQEEAQTLASQLAALPPRGVQLAKAAFAAARRDGYPEWETAQFAACWASSEREVMMRAFLEAT
jgi:enoyl-CoA hydratase/carnithine racemase